MSKNPYSSYSERISSTYSKGSSAARFTDDGQEFMSEENFTHKSREASLRVSSDPTIQEASY
jgi:hypothetical protein